MKLLRWIIHPLAKWWAHKMLTAMATPNPWAYPLLVDMMVYEYEYYKRYLAGESYKQMLTQELKEKGKRLKRTFKKKKRRADLSNSNPEEYYKLIRRYERYCSNIEYKSDIAKQFEECEAAYQSHIKNKQQ